MHSTRLQRFKVGLPIFKTTLELWAAWFWRGKSSGVIYFAEDMVIQQGMMGTNKGPDGKPLWTFQQTGRAASN